MQTNLRDMVLGAACHLLVHMDAFIYGFFANVTPSVRAIFVHKPHTPFIYALPLNNYLFLINVIYFYFCLHTRGL